MRLTATLARWKVRLPDALTIGTTIFMLAAVLAAWAALSDPLLEVGFHGLTLAALVAGVGVGRDADPGKDTLWRLPGYAMWLYVYHRGAGVFIEELGLPTYERALSAADHALFGGDVSLLLQAWHDPLLTEVVQLAYSSYYVVLFALPLGLALRGRHREMALTLGLVIIAHTTLVLGNTLMPARWPVLLHQDPRVAEVIVYPFATEGLWLTAPLRDSIANGTRMLWDSMPSGHTCISLLMTVVAGRFMPRLLWLMAPLTAGIVFGTLYLRYHYGVDILAGAALAGLVLWFGPRHIAGWDRRLGHDPHAVHTRPGEVDA